MKLPFSLLLARGIRHTRTHTYRHARAHQEGDSAIKPVLSLVHIFVPNPPILHALFLLVSLSHGSYKKAEQLGLLQSCPSPRYMRNRCEKGEEKIPISFMSLGALATETLPCHLRSCQLCVNKIPQKPSMLSRFHNLGNTCCRESQVR